MFYNCYYCCDVTDVMVVMSLMCLSVIDTITSVTVDLLARIITNVSEKLRASGPSGLGSWERPRGGGLTMVNPG